MQIIIQAICNKSNKSSLRKAILNDVKTLEEFGFSITEYKRNHRLKGWSKLKCKECKGSLNIRWIPESKTLEARAISKGTPASELMGYFMAYLTKYHNESISVITVSYI
jgi:hypothetical protein